MKTIIPILSCIFLLLAACTSSNKNTTNTQSTNDSLATVDPVEDTRQLTEVITRFVRAYVSKDNQKANKLIHPDLGLYIIYRPGAMDTYQHIDSLDFNTPIPQHFPYNGVKNDFALTFDNLPVFDCGTDKWDKLGLVVDTSKNADQLTYIAQFKHKFEEITDDELAQIKAVEKDCYRVILTNGDNLIFHVKKYKGAWYVFLLDRAYGWCDA